jgi:tRNA(Ile)-lysidine synthase
MQPALGLFILAACARITYHSLVRISQPSLRLDTSLFKPGMRVAVGLSGGADSAALLCSLAQRSRELGLVLHAAHLHHGLRGEEADGDLEFSRALAERLGIPFHFARVDAAAEARANLQTGKPAESIEEAARRLRYAWFRQLIVEIPLDAVATAHTLDDQAETVLAKFLRGAWTEGLAGIFPRVEGVERPLLATTRAEIEAWLNAIGQPWREDSSNRQLSFTRNRIRHELLPLLEQWNPQMRSHLANMATLARDEEAWWAAELDRLAPQFILRGTPVRGGGRAASEGVALDVTRLAVLAPALQRRLLRRAAQELGAEPDFAATEALLSMALHGRAGQRLELAQSLTAERTARELRLSSIPCSAPKSKSASAPPQQYQVPIPGQIDAPDFGLTLEISLTTSFAIPRSLAPSLPAFAILRNWRPGDRVRLRYSSGPRKVKEVLEHLRVTGSERAVWPVLELDGRLIWMQGVELEPEPGLSVTARLLGAGRDA